MPPARFQLSVRRMMVAVVAVALTFTDLAIGSTRLGCGSVTVYLTFHVVDDRTERPIAGAEIELWPDLSAPMVSVPTGLDGSAWASCRAGCTSYSGPFYRQYRRLHYGDGLRVKALGYQPVNALLRDYTTLPAYHDMPLTPSIVVRMKRKPGFKPSRPPSSG